MEIQMTEIEKCDFKYGEEVFTISTGKVENGWWWECSGFYNAGVTPSREMALESAKKEIKARGGLVL